jgi:1-acyl-sn-glycerol-3-phosphate acyltransferase
MNHVLRGLFFALIVRPVVLILLGLNIRHRERLPKQGPAIIIANHNSHLDTLVLMTLFPQKLLPKIRPVAAMDYFLRNRLLAWFSLKIIGILPLSRKLTVHGPDVFAGASSALANGEILLLFPEGSRGEPEQLGQFKSGVAHLVERHPTVPVVPIFLHGLGKALPKGEAILVPFFCDVFIGTAQSWQGERKEFMQQLSTEMTALAEEGTRYLWN